MTEETNTFPNSFFELAHLFGQMPNGNQSKSVGQYFNDDQSIAADQVLSIQTLFRSCDRELMMAGISYEVLVEYLNFIQGYKREFSRSLLAPNSDHFFKKFRPNDKAVHLRTMGQFVQHTAKGRTKGSLQRAALLNDLNQLSEDLMTANLNDAVKEVVALNLRSIKAMLSSEATFSDSEIQSKIREIVYDYVAAYEKSEVAKSDFTTKLMKFVGKHGVSTIGYVALANDAVGSVEFLINLLGT